MTMIWHERVPERWRTRAWWIVLAGTSVAFLLQVGRMVPQRPAVAGLVAVAVLALGVSLAEPAIIPLLAMPLTVIGMRVGGGGVDLSLSDAALFAAFWPALFLGKRPYSPAMRSLLWLSALYQAATLFTVVANPYLANTVEWFHAGLLVAGALIVGWAVGRAGYARQGLNLILVAAGFLAVSTIVQALLQYAGGDLGPVKVTWPFPMHKNFLGTVLGFAAVIAYARPMFAGWSKGWAMSAFWLCAAAVGTVQSRQGIIGLGIAVLVISLRTDPVRKRSKLIVLAVVPAALFVATLIRDEVAAGNVHSSIFTRLDWFDNALAIWRQNPLFGVGLRYWTAGRLTGGQLQPPNAEIEVLASAGLVGLAGFIVAFVGALVILWRVDPRYGTLAFTIVLTRLVQAQFDLFWAAAQVSIPFVVAGICLGAKAFDDEKSQVARELALAHHLRPTRPLPA